MRNHKTSRQVDCAGAFASTMCAIHCAFCALVPTILATTGLGFLLSHEVELGLTFLAVSLASFALFLSWRRIKSLTVVTLLSLGILGLLASRAMETHDHGEHHHGEHHHGEEHHGEEHHGEEHHGEEHHGEEHHGEEHHGEEHHGEEHHVENHRGEEHHDEEHHTSKHGNETAHQFGDSIEGHHNMDTSKSNDLNLFANGLGVLAGVLLVAGHFLSIYLSRRRTKTIA